MKPRPIILVILAFALATSAPAAQTLASPTNVLDYGAKGDGTTDDSPAIQKAIDAGAKSIYLPAGQYRVTSAINLTNKANGGIKFYGDTKSGATATGTTIIGDTGNVVIDTTGSQFITLRDFNIVSGTANPSVIGILCARSAVSNYAQFHIYESIRINLATAPTANSNNGSIGIYNYAAELWNARDLYIVADVPVVFCHTNIWSVASPCTTIHSGATSMSTASLTGTTMESRTNACVVLSGAYKIDITDSYMRRTIRPANAYEFAIRIADHSCCLLTFNVFVEGYNRFLYTQNPIYDLNVRSQLSKAAGDPDSLIYLDSSGKGQPGIMSGSISIFPTVEPGVVSHNLIETSSSSHQLGVRNCELWLASKQNLSIAGGYTTGLVIHENASTSTVTLTPDAAYCSAVRLRQGSTDFVGKVNFGGNIGFFGTPATDQPTITGSCGNNAALSNLLTALANMGLIKDSTTR